MALHFVLSRIRAWESWSGRLANTAPEALFFQGAPCLRCHSVRGGRRSAHGLARVALATMSSRAWDGRSISRVVGRLFAPPLRSPALHGGFAENSVAPLQSLAKARTFAEQARCKLEAAGLRTHGALSSAGGGRRLGSYAATVRPCLAWRLEQHHCSA